MQHRPKNVVGLREAHHTRGRFGVLSTQTLQRTNAFYLRRGTEDAFLRLQEQILGSSSDQTLFLWTPLHDPYNQGLLATAPTAFCRHLDCFQWHPDLESIKKQPFDPYSTFRPVFFPHLNGRPGPGGYIVTSGRGKMDAPLDFGGSLGSQGLQISLLAADPGNDTYSAQEALEGRVFYLGVLCIGFIASDYHDHRVFHLGVRLCSARQVGILQGFIPNRLGAFRRLPCVSIKSQYISEGENGLSPT